MRSKLAIASRQQTTKVTSISRIIQRSVAFGAHKSSIE